MKIALTGHTRGLGLALLNHFSRNHEVVGMSRSNGFDLTTDVSKVVQVAESCDLFLNNAHVGAQQAVLLMHLHARVKIVTSGSRAVHRTVNLTDYDLAKKTVEKAHELLMHRTHKPMLLLRMGYLPDIPYAQVINAIEFWMANPSVSLIELTNR